MRLSSPRGTVRRLDAYSDSYVRAGTGPADPATRSRLREEVRRIQQLLERQAYVADPELATALHLAIALRKPLLVEGPAGVGKTEIAKVLAQALDTELIRLQCYEGLDAAAALYEWNYPKQMLHLKMDEHSGRSVAEKEASIFSEPFLL